jgi:predicted nucleic acid-binding Zn ribbon protein
MRKQGSFSFLINNKRTRMRHWKEEVKTGKPEQLAPPTSF